MAGTVHDKHRATSSVGDQKASRVSEVDTPQCILSDAGSSVTGSALNVGALRGRTHDF